MTIAGVKAGDIVRADVRGQTFFAEVTGREQRGRQKVLTVQPLTPAVGYYSVSAREVKAHYRKARHA